MLCNCTRFVILLREPCRHLQGEIMYKCLKTRTSKVSHSHLHLFYCISAHSTKLLATCQPLQVIRTGTCLPIPQSKNCSSATSNPSSLPFLSRTTANIVTKGVFSPSSTISPSLRDLSKRTDSTTHSYPYGLPNQSQIQKGLLNSFSAVTCADPRCIPEKFLGLGPTGMS